jgi:hypothetical protein
MVNNNINKTNNHTTAQLIQHKKTTTNDIVNQGHGFGQAHKCTWVKPVNGIPTLPSVYIVCAYSSYLMGPSLKTLITIIMAMIIW